MRILLAALAAFGISAAVGWVLIPALRALHAGQSIKEIGPNWHKSKEGTPTMGGIMFIAAAAVSVLAFGWRDMAEGSWQALFVLAFALVCGGIGFIDDYAKIRKHENTGLTAGWKFLLQLAAAIAFLALLRWQGILSPTLYVPFLNAEVTLTWGVYLVFAAFVMVGCVNAVNLTDGLDGLAGSVTLAVCVFFAVLSKWWEMGAVGVFAGALGGGLLGFLLYNFHPAKVFMGDTGSLFLGGAVCAMAFALDVPLVLVLVGVIYIAETMSDILQVGYFKLTHGKRIFRMAPLHHHLELGGLERGAYRAHLHGDHRRLLPAGLCGRDVPLRHLDVKIGAPRKAAFWLCGERRSKGANAVFAAGGNEVERTLIRRKGRVPWPEKPNEI